MSRNLGTASLYDVGMIDGRNERPLAIAFVTILMGSVLAFGLSFMSTGIGAQARHLGSAPAISTTIK